MLDHADPDGEAARTAAARHGCDPSALIEILHDLQAERGCVTDAALAALARALNLGKAEVHGVASFYHDFRRAPAGPVVVKLCRAEACQSRGARALIERVCARLGADLGGTSAEGVTVEAVYCLGNCALAPAALVNGRPVGRADTDRVLRAVAAARA